MADPVEAFGCDHSYPDLCILPEVADLECVSVLDQSMSQITVYQPDPHGFDGDLDRIGSEKDQPPASGAWRWAGCSARRTPRLHRRSLTGPGVLLVGGDLAPSPLHDRQVWSGVLACRSSGCRKMGGRAVGCFRMRSSPAAPWIVSRWSSSWNAIVAWSGSVDDRRRMGSPADDACNTTSNRCNARRRGIVNLPAR
jgi:hypothetical protein